MDFITHSSLYLMIMVALANSLGYDRMDIIRNNNRRTSRINRPISVNGNSYTNGLLDNVNVVIGRNCYDRCYDANLAGIRRVNGCTCSRFDFRRGNNRINNRRNGLGLDCNCPIGTVCEYEFGTYRCVNTHTGRVNTGRRNYVHGNTNLGIPGSRRLGGHCGYLTPACRADSFDSNQAMRYTYSYRLGTCIRQHVYLGCEVRGSRNNLFATRQGCTRTCGRGF